jgi:hypothetical protein
VDILEILRSTLEYKVSTGNINAEVGKISISIDVVHTPFTPFTKTLLYIHTKRKYQSYRISFIQKRLGIFQKRLGV